jgi:hypothetical protein
VKLSFYYDGRSGRNITVSYNAMKVFDAESEISAAFIFSGNPENPIWGVTE